MGSGQDQEASMTSRAFLRMCCIDRLSTSPVQSFSTELRSIGQAFLLNVSPVSLWRSIFVKTSGSL